MPKHYVFILVLAIIAFIALTPFFFLWEFAKPRKKVAGKRTQPFLRQRYEQPRPVTDLDDYHRFLREIVTVTIVNRRDPDHCTLKNTYFLLTQEETHFSNRN